MERQVYTTLRLQRENVLRDGRVADTVEFGVQSAQVSVVYLTIKRLVDFSGALLGLILLWPLLILVALLMRRDSSGPLFHRRCVLEKQEYAGGTPCTFDAFKFRTMIVDADEYLRKNPQLLAEFQKDYKLKEDPRVTPFGSKLRTTSLDELPQLVNVLRGQMSLVGPRMISPPELEHYGPYAAKLLSVKPGLTGLWQVSGRQNTSYAERVRLDMWYIENRSIFLDVWILLRTIKCVLLRQGAF